jgi:hypothetical protein
MDFIYFWSSKIPVSPTDVVSSFSPLRAASPPTDIAMPSCRVMLPSHGAASASSFDNASSYHLPSRAETEVLNLHHRRWPPSRTIRLSSFTSIKGHLNLDHSLHHSTASLFYLLSSQNTTPLKLHPPSSFPFTTISRISFICTTTPTTMMN